jgi:hypothetical protein
MSKLNIKVMLICLFDIKGIVHYGFVPLKRPPSTFSLQSTFKFSNVYSSAFVEKYQNFSQQSDFAS